MGWFNVKHLRPLLGKSLIGLHFHSYCLMIFTIQIIHIYKRIRVSEYISVLITIKPDDKLVCLLQELVSEAMKEG